MPAAARQLATVSIFSLLLQAAGNDQVISPSADESQRGVSFDVTSRQMYLDVTSNLDVTRPSAPAPKAGQIAVKALPGAAAVLALGALSEVPAVKQLLHPVSERLEETRGRLQDHFHASVNRDSRQGGKNIRGYPAAVPEEDAAQPATMSLVQYEGQHEGRRLLARSAGAMFLLLLACGWAFRRSKTKSLDLASRSKKKKKSVQVKSPATSTPVSPRTISTATPGDTPRTELERATEYYRMQSEASLPGMPASSDDDDDMDDQKRVPDYFKINTPCQSRASSKASIKTAAYGWEAEDD